MVTYQRYACGQTRSDIGTDTDGLVLFTSLIHLMMLVPLITRVPFSVFHLLAYGLVSNIYSSMQHMHICTYVIYFSHYNFEFEICRGLSRYSWREGHVCCRSDKKFHISTLTLSSRHIRSSM